MSPYNDNVKLFVEKLIENKHMDGESRKEILTTLITNVIELLDTEERMVANAMIEKKFIPEVNKWSTH